MIIHINKTKQINGTQINNNKNLSCFHLVPGFLSRGDSWCSCIILRKVTQHWIPGASDTCSSKWRKSPASPPYNIPPTPPPPRNKSFQKIALGSHASCVLLCDHFNLFLWWLKVSDAHLMLVALLCGFTLTSSIAFQIKYTFSSMKRRNRIILKSTHCMVHTLNKVWNDLWALPTPRGKEI